jgi:hypothetical protein
MQTTSLKAKIIQLDSQDTVATVIKKISHEIGGRVVLVWPKRTRILNRRLDIILISRFCSRMGLNVCFVSNDERVIRFAQSLGIAHFSNESEALNTPWRKGRFKQRNTLIDKKSRPKISRIVKQKDYPEWMVRDDVRLIAFSIGVLAVLMILLLFIPSAQIILNPKVTSQEITFSVYANPTIKNVYLSGNIPARIMTLIVSGSDRVKTSGALQIAEKSAEGSAIFVNLTDNPINIPSGTVVLTLAATPIRFVVTEAGSVPGGSGQKVELPVRAILPGSSGNIGIDAIKGIEGELGLVLSVTNEKPTTGGTDRNSPAPNASDYDDLYFHLSQTLKQKAREELSVLLSADDVVIWDTLAINRIIEKKFDPEEVQPSDYLSLSERVEFQVEYIARKDIEKLAGMMLDTSISSNHIPVLNSIEIKSYKAPEILSNNVIKLEYHASRKITTKINTETVVSIVSGQSSEIAIQQLLERFSFENPPVIKISPGWLKRLPFLPFRIDVVVLN